MFSTQKNISELHCELLDINLAFSAYIEESKKHLEAVKLQSALNAKKSFEVVEILSNKCKSYNTVLIISYNV